MNTAYLSVASAYLSLVEWIQSGFLMGLSVMGIIGSIGVSLFVVGVAFVVTLGFNKKWRQINYASSFVMTLLSSLILWAAGVVFFGLTQNDMDQKVGGPTKAAFSTTAEDVFSTLMESWRTGEVAKASAEPKYQSYVALVGDKFVRVIEDPSVDEVGLAGAPVPVRKVEPIFNGGLLAEIDKYRQHAGKMPLSLRDIGIQDEWVNSEVPTSEQVGGVAPRSNARIAADTFAINIADTKRAYDNALLIVNIVFVVVVLLLVLTSLLMGIGRIKLTAVRADLENFASDWETGADVNTDSQSQKAQDVAIL